MTPLSPEMRLFGFMADTDYGTEYGIVIAGSPGDAIRMAADMTEASDEQIELLDALQLINSQFDGKAILTTPSEI